MFSTTCRINTADVARRALTVQCLMRTVPPSPYFWHDTTCTPKKKISTSLIVRCRAATRRIITRHGTHVFKTLTCSLPQVRFIATKKNPNLSSLVASNSQTWSVEAAISDYSYRLRGLIYSSLVTCHLSPQLIP